MLNNFDEFRKEALADTYLKMLQPGELERLLTSWWKLNEIYRGDAIADQVNRAISGYEVVEGIRINFNTFKRMQRSDLLMRPGVFDPVTDRATLETGLYGHLWGMKVYVVHPQDPPIPDGEILVILPDQKKVEI